MKGKKILFDTNIILDVLLDRQPHAEASVAAWAAAESGRVEGLIAAHAVTTIHYLLQKQVGNAKAKPILSSVLRVFKVAPVDSPVIDEALALPFTGFEDAVTAAAARHAGCVAIVTRDPKGFRGSQVRAFAPDAISPLLLLK